MSYANKLLLVLFFVFNISLAQNDTSSPTNTFINENNFLHKEYLEKFSLHTNKSVYFSGEDIWFKAYIAYDITDTPNYRTTNLHLNIYDADKNLITHQLVLVENGKVAGSIKLPEDLKTNTYFIQLDTHWNRDFKNTYIKPIQVNNLQDGFMDSQENELSENGAISFQFYPESNVLLDNTENTIYFTVSQNNVPIALSGNVTDANGDIISKITSDKNGLGSFKLRAYTEKNYFVVANNSKFEIPKAQETGFILHKKENVETNDVVGLSITTNKATIQQEKGKTIFAVIHRKGYALSAIPVTISEEYYSYNLKLLKTDLFNGVNTITLFNSTNQAIAERNIFSNNKKLIELEATKISSTKDSTTIKLNLKNIYTNTNVSISVLPQNSLMYQNQYNIVTDYLVTPYLTDKTGNITRYFSENFNQNKLDTYIQTKSKNNFVALPNNNIKTRKAEVGTRIRGSVMLKEASTQNAKVMLTSQENNIVLVSKLKPNNTFVFDSLLLKQNSNYKLSLVDFKGKLLKANIHVKEQLIDYKPELVSSKDLNNYHIKGFEYTDTDDTSSRQIKKQEYLDEVVLKAKKTKKIVFPDDYPDPKVRASSFTKTYIIKENRYYPNQTVMDVIKDLPGVEVDNFSTKIRSTRGAKSIITGSRNDEVAVILNGVRVSDFDLLRSINATEIAEAKVNASGAGYGLDGFAGVVILKTKGEINSFKGKATNTASTLKVGTVDFGFNIPTANYTNFDMQFPSKNSRIFYSTLDWLPNVNLKPNSDNTITVYNDNLDEIKLLINGQNDKGNLVFKLVTINNKSNQ